MRARILTYAGYVEGEVVTFKNGVQVIRDKRGNEFTITKRNRKRIEII